MSAQQATGFGRAMAARPTAPTVPALDPVAVARWLPAVVLTMLDAALTYAWLHLGVAAEANPWLAALVETSGPGAAMAVRAGIGLALVGVLGLLARDHVSARRGLAFVTVALAVVCSWHVVGSVMVAVA